MSEHPPSFTSREEILAGFHRLFKEKYHIADQATFFLEIQARVSGVNITITNQRDALSHFVTFLRNPQFTIEDQSQQLANAEEHLRRAIAEPYEIAVSLEAQFASELREQYIVEVLSLADPRVAELPTGIELAHRLDGLQAGRLEARQAKARSIWDASWENGIKTYIEAFVGLRELTREIEEHLALARRIRSEAAKGQLEQAAVRRKDQLFAFVGFFLAITMAIMLLSQLV